MNGVCYAFRNEGGHEAELNLQNKMCSWCFRSGKRGVEDVGGGVESARQVGEEKKSRHVNIEGPLQPTPAVRLRSWATRKHLREDQISKLVSLLDPLYLRSLRVRKKSRAWPKVPHGNNFRHHFYRQAAHILGWVEQQVFEEEFLDIIRSSFPDTNNANTSETTEEGKTSDLKLKIL